MPAAVLFTRKLGAADEICRTHTRQKSEGEEEYHND